ncbi:MAG: hypothetical protein IKJ91_03430 [Clostridia bacterium]|nr:hypothetical protein [Clostridia bacterium]
MKRSFIVALIAVLALVMVLASCGDSSAGKGGESFFDGYVIIRGTQNVDATPIKNAISERSGVELEVLNSALGKGATEQAKEILLGDTGREASNAAREGMRTCDFVIKQDGDKIVIAGGSTKANAEAVKYFVENFLSADGKGVNIPAEGYTVRGEYLFDALTIDGVDVKEFKFYDAGTLATGESMFTWFADTVIGAEMETAKELQEGEHYIIYDDTSLAANEYEIKVENGNLVILGSFNTVRVALEYFRTTYMPALAEKGKTYNITAEDNVLVTVKEPEMYTKEQVMKVLEEVYNDNERFIVGEEGGKLTPANETAEKFYKASGKYPALLGEDLGCYGLDLMDVDASTWSQYLCEYVNYAEKGGLITLSSHWRNPTGNYEHDWADCRGKLGREAKWQELLTEGTELNLEFKKQLDCDARFLAALRDNGVPVIWRPMHEQNGSFFWWCIEQDNGYVLDGSYFANLWRYVYKYYTEDWQLDNLLWEFAANKTNGRNYQNTDYCYPGDEYCDMVGLDWYLGGEYNLTDEGNSYADLMKLGKITNLTEFGISDSLEAENPEYQERVFNSMNLLEDVMLRMVDEDGFKMAYLLTWTGRDTIGQMMRADKFMNSGYIIDLEEMKALLDSYK